MGDATPAVLILVRDWICPGICGEPSAMMGGLSAGCCLTGSRCLPFVFLGMVAGNDGRGVASVRDLGVG